MLEEEKYQNYLRGHEDAVAQLVDSLLEVTQKNGQDSMDSDDVDRLVEYIRECLNDAMGNK